ncbi:MAG: hypothetical protein WCF67_22395 [Chitinophagaceae bacterium]
MDVPVIYQHYPAVPLSELSDLYSAGNNTLDGQRICIVSHLPKTLTIHEDFPFNNAYTLFIENTATVDSIAWTYKLYNKGERKNDNTFFDVSGAGTNRFSLAFRNSLFDASGDFRFDKLRIFCEVRRGGNRITLEVEHNFAKMINVREINFTAANMSPFFAGNPQVTNYLMNHLRGYFSTPGIIWNGGIVDIDTSGEFTLQKIVMAIIHRNLVTADIAWLQPDGYFDLNEYTNHGIQAFLNNDTPYAGTFANGLCDLPLHVLNDVLQANNQLPDFFNITKANNVYGMIVHEAPFVKSVSDELLTPVSAKLAASKQRLISNKPRFIELFHLSLFPKSAINLTAAVVKYLFECSKKNKCQDCKYGFEFWQHLGLDALKDQQDFLKNTLTHYYHGPANTIDDFSTKAVQTIAHVWSPVGYTVLHVEPRILKAYFAKRVLKRINTAEAMIDFERIDSTAVRVGDNELALATQPAYEDALGRDVYLVVDTLHCRGKQLTIHVHPAGNNLTGNTNPIELMTGAVFATEFTPAVGNFDALKNNDTVLPGGGDVQENYKIDHKDRAIINLTLRPSTRALFDGWANTLATNTAELRINVRLPDNARAYYGNEVTATEEEKMFLSADDPYDNNARFRIRNRIVYDMYHPGNRYRQRIGTTANFADPTGKVENSFVWNIANATPATPFRLVSYYYHDADGYEHLLGELQLQVTPMWPLGTPATAGQVVRMIDISTLQHYNRKGVNMRILTNNSARDYVDVDRLSGLLGAMAKTNTADLGFNGFSNSDGSAGVSVSHINGVNGDLRFLRTNFSGGPCVLTEAGFDFNRQSDFHNALHLYGWGQLDDMLSENFMLGGVSTILPHCRHYHSTKAGTGIPFRRSQDVVQGVDWPQLMLEGPLAGTQFNGTGVAGATVTRHNHHLHMQGFDVSMIDTVNPAP